MTEIYFHKLTYSWAKKRESIHTQSEERKKKQERGKVTEFSCASIRFYVSPEHLLRAKIQNPSWECFQDHLHRRKGPYKGSCNNQTPCCYSGFTDKKTMWTLIPRAFLWTVWLRKLGEGEKEITPETEIPSLN